MKTEAGWYKITDMKKVIKIIGSSGGCGATFVASSLAFIMGRYCDGVTYLEGCRPAFEPAPFYELSLDKHIPRKRLADFAALKKAGKPTDNRVNLYGNVNWAVRIPEPAGIGEAVEIAKTPACAEDEPVRPPVYPQEVAGRYILWDSRERRAGDEGRCKSDLILCVIDPLPGRVMAAEKTIKELINRPQHNVLWVFNKGEKKDVMSAEKFLGIRGDFHIPIEPLEKFYAAQRKGVSPADPAGDGSRLLPTLEPKTRQAFDEIASYILTLF